VRSKLLALDNVGYCRPCLISITSHQLFTELTKHESDSDCEDYLRNLAADVLPFLAQSIVMRSSLGGRITCCSPSLCPFVDLPRAHDLFRIGKP